MHAYQVARYKQDLTLSDLAEPSVGSGDVLIRVQAASLNQLDEKVRLGEFKQLLSYKPPFTLGHDAAGTVLAVGSDVTRFKVGDEVFCRPRDGRIGTFAEQISVDQSDVALRPTSITVTEAASLPLVALTAWQALVERGQVRPGHKVLIHAGSGGVGTIAIQLARHLGAYVATTASARNADFLTELGADLVIDYASDRFEDKVSGYDLVIDNLGQVSVLRSLTVLKPGGAVIGLAGPPTPSYASAAGANPLVRTAITALSSRVRRAAKSLGVTYEFLFMHASGEQLQQIATLVDDGVIRPVLGKTIAFTDLPQALGRVGSDGVRGKTVMIVPWPGPGNHPSTNHTYRGEPS